MLSVFRAEDSNEELSQTQEESTRKKQTVGASLVNEADRYDEQECDCAGNRIEQVELSDIDLVDLLDGLLHRLRLVQHKIVSE